MHLRLTTTAASFGMLLVFAHASPILSQCLTAADSQQMIHRLDTDAVPSLNAKLRKELLEMKRVVSENERDPNPEIEELKRITRGYSDTVPRIINLDKRFEKKKDKNEIRLCEMFKTNGFLGQSLVGYDGAAAAFYLYTHFASVESRQAMVPAIFSAINKNELPRDEAYAAFIDRLKLEKGQRQLYGTQAFVKNNLLVIAPIEGEKLIDRRRNALGLSTLSKYLKYLELLYRTPVIRERAAADITTQVETLLTADQAKSADSEEVIRVKSELVGLNVSVLSKTPLVRPAELEAADFKIFEDGREMQLSFFAKTSAPFDLVLLLDLSGSTEDKQGLIRKATKRFIEAARPTDRISIVTFTTDVNVVAPLTLDREPLFKSIEKIKDTGWSRVWDSLRYVLLNSFGKKEPGRRRALVMMSDGIDNTLNIIPKASVLSFGELLDTVRYEDTIVVPIYIEIGDNSDRIYRSARSSMAALANESGGQVYSAKKLENLDGVYETVLTDLGTVYGVGYTPLNESPAGTWHTLRVEIKDHPDLTVRSRQGYFVK